MTSTPGACWDLVESSSHLPTHRPPRPSNIPLYICLSIIHTHIHPSVHPTSNSTAICPPIQSHPSICPSIILPVHLPSLPTFICPPSTPTSIHPFVHPSFNLSIQHPTTSVCPPIHSPIPRGHLLQAVPCTGTVQTLPLFQGKYRPQTPETQEAPLVHRAASHSRTPSPGRGAGPQPPRGQD